MPPNKNKRKNIEQQIRDERWEAVESGLQRTGDVIGKGAFGEVSKQKYWGTPVAVKELLVEGSEDLDEEIRILSELRHPNIVNMLAHTDKKIIMELHDGSLDHIKTFKEMAFVARECVRALCYMQSDKDCTFHGDIKPDNILVDLDEKNNITRVVLGDVGLARSCNPTNYFEGTPGYMPHPHEGEINSLTDAHALAVSLLDAYFVDDVHAYYPALDEKEGLSDNVGNFILKTPTNIQGVLTHMVHAYKNDNLNKDAFQRDLYLRTIILSKWDDILAEESIPKKPLEKLYDLPKSIPKPIPISKLPKLPDAPKLNI